MKINFKNVLIIVLIAISGFLFLQWRISQAKVRKGQKQYQEEILKGDSVKKVSDGIYSKYVEQESRLSLMQDLKDSLPQLWKIIRQRDETIKMNSSVILGLNNKVDSLKDVTITYVTIHDSVFPKYTFTAQYPDPLTAFITYSGSILRGKLSGSWVFGKLSLGVTVTETEAGIWKSYITGPSWIMVDKVTVSSSIKPVKTVFARMYVGLGYTYFFDQTSGPLLSVALDLNRRFLFNGNLGIKFGSLSLLYGL